jgi:hypothetical protein
MKLPLGPAIDLAHLMRTCHGEFVPLPDGADYRGCRTEPGVWVLVYRLPDGQLEERTVPRWESEENRAQGLRQRFRLVTTSPPSSRPGR